MLDEETMEANTTRFKERYSGYREYGCLLKVSEGQLSAVMRDIDRLNRKVELLMTPNAAVKPRRNGD